VNHVPGANFSACRIGTRICSQWEWEPLASSGALFSPCDGDKIQKGVAGRLTLLRVSFYSSAKDNLTGQNVAVKKIMKPFSTPVLSKRTYRELKLLKHLKHENVGWTEPRWRGDGLLICARSFRSVISLFLLLRICMEVFSGF
jgi:hypothetical protein